MNTVDAAPSPALPAGPALERLLARLAVTPDFVAAADAQRRLQGTLASDKAHLRQVAALVQDDVALTGKFLRLINAVYFRPAGGGEITSLQRAVAVMGFDAAQRVCLSLKLLDQLPDSPTALLLREDFLRALLASRLARELSGPGPVADEQGTCAMFRNLGRMLVASHCPDDALAIRRSVPRVAPGLAQREYAESRRRLGASYASLGQHVARHWGWPPALVEAAGLEEPPGGADAGPNRLWVSWTANELADLLLYQDPDGWDAQLGALTTPRLSASPFSPAQARAALAATRRDLERIAESVGLPLAQLRAWQQPDVTAAAPANEPSLQAVQRLSVEAAQMSELLLQPDAAQRLPRQALGSLFEALGPQRAVLLLLRRDDGLLHVAHVLGTPLAGGGRGWTVDAVNGTDLFARTCQQGADLLVSDARRPQVSAHLPPGFGCAGQPQSLLLLPMRLQGRTLGLIYMDRATAPPLAVNDELMRLLRLVRNQTLAALR